VENHNLTIDHYCDNNLNVTFPCKIRICLSQKMYGVNILISHSNFQGLMYGTAIQIGLRSEDLLKQNVVFIQHCQFSNNCGASVSIIKAITGAKENQGDSTNIVHIDKCNFIKNCQINFFKETKDVIYIGFEPLNMYITNYNFHENTLKTIFKKYIGPLLGKVCITIQNTILQNVHKVIYLLI